MPIYLSKGKGYRYDFIYQKERYTSKYYKTKKEAKNKEVEKRNELKNRNNNDNNNNDDSILFRNLVKIRLEYLKQYKSEIYYIEHVYKSNKWIKLWGSKKASKVTYQDIEKFLVKRKKISSQTANKEIRYLKAFFKFAIKREYLKVNPIENIEFFPIGKNKRYVPTIKEVKKILEIADNETREYLITIFETMGRMSEINTLKWKDIDFENNCLFLYTRKKKGGHLTPRLIPMTKNLNKILLNRYERNKNKIEYVFWHCYKSSKTGNIVIGPYKDRKKIMRTLCRKANITYFRFHALRHCAASIMDSANVPINSIQKILGHENRQTTEIYLHSLNKNEIDAIKTFEEKINE